MEIVDYGNPLHDMNGEFECTECGNPVDREFDVCSGTCFEASML